jgi:hypothetical protein
MSTFQFDGQPERRSLKHKILCDLAPAICVISNQDAWTGMQMSSLGQETSSIVY